MPLADGSGDFLSDDPETRLLDRHFRLLREDFIAPVRDALAKNEHTQNTNLSLPLVGIAGVELHERFVNSRKQEGEVDLIYGRGPVGLRLSLDTNALVSKVKQFKLKDLAESLQQRGKLQRGSLVLLCDCGEVI